MFKVGDRVLIKTGVCKGEQALVLDVVFSRIHPGILYCTVQVDGELFTRTYYQSSLEKVEEVSNKSNELMEFLLS